MARTRLGSAMQLAGSTSWIEQLKPLDRQVMVAYLEGMDAASTAEITGLSSRNVAVKIHRIKQVLARRFQEKASLAHDSGQGGRDER